MEETKQPIVLLLIVENREVLLLEYVKFILSLVWHRAVGGVLFWDGARRKPIWYMRRKMIERALQTNCTHVLFLDTDVIPPDDFLQKLLKIDSDIATGVYYDTQKNPCSRKNGTYYQGKGVEDVDVAAMGCSLIKRKVLETVPYPEPDGPKIDADMEFFTAVKSKGFSVRQDFSLVSTHLLLAPF